jgi:hypothetical protein
MKKKKKLKLSLETETSCSPHKRELVKYIAGTFMKMTGNIQNLVLNTSQEDFGFEPVHLVLFKMLKDLPESIQKLFTFNLRVEILKCAGSVSIHSLLSERLDKSINVHSNFKSVAQAIENEFGDDLTNSVARQRMKVNFPVEVKSKVEMNPEVLTLILNRIVQTRPNVIDSFMNHPFTVDKEITVNQIVYILMARIEYSTETGFYSTIVLDLGNSKTYRYDQNGNVGEYIDFEPTMDTNSVVLFYIPKLDSKESEPKPKGTKRSFDEITELESEEAVKIRVVREDHVGKSQVVQENNTSQILQETTASVLQETTTADVQETTATGLQKTSNICIQDTVNAQVVLGDCPFYRPSYDVFPAARLYFIAVERKLMTEVGILPAELLDFKAKFYFNVYQLGSQQFSFKPGPDGQPYYALEIILTCLASNLNAVMKLFQLTGFRPNIDSVEYHLTIAIIKMLLGCKNISLEKLMTVLSIFSGSTFSIDINMDLKDSALLDAFKMIFTGIKSTLIGQPVSHTIKYNGLDTDDPISITRKSSLKPVKLSKLINPREAVIKGIWFDSVEKLQSPSFRIRTIFKSNSEIVVVEVERWIKTFNSSQVKSIDSRPLKLNSADYECIGVVSLGQGSAIFKSYFIDNFSGNTNYRSFIPGIESDSYKINQSNKDFYENVRERESILLFFSKKSNQCPERIYSKQIPPNLFEIAFSDLADDLNFNLSK